MKTHRRLSITPGNGDRPPRPVLRARRLGVRRRRAGTEARPSLSSAARTAPCVASQSSPATSAGIANVPDQFTGAGNLFTRKFNCTGRAVQVRRVERACSRCASSGTRPRAGSEADPGTPTRPSSPSPPALSRSSCTRRDATTRPTRLHDRASCSALRKPGRRPPPRALPRRAERRPRATSRNVTSLSPGSRPSLRAELRVGALSASAVRASENSPPVISAIAAASRDPAEREFSDRHPIPGIRTRTGRGRSRRSGVPSATV